MFKWRRNQRESSELVRQLRTVLTRHTMELVRVANEAEREGIRAGGPENTDVRELVRIARVQHAQNVFLDQVLRGCETGLTLAEISHEVIDPVVEKSVVGEVAWYAINQAMSSANRRLNRR
ncbi:MAG: hypothetical protein R3286_21005 [Gammaproteobacteria bacterium]|nr:hypothetical protein [Gammaproteobacteria bacterium]